MPDSYRALENGQNPHTVRWLAVQAARTQQFLEGLEDRRQIADELLVAADVPRKGIPSQIGGHTYIRPDAGQQLHDLVVQRAFGATAGKGWREEYGDVRVEADFRALFRYSPLHNVRPGVRYPKTLLVTGDHDDRVVPAHSYKFVATLQAARADAQVWLDVGRDIGHGGDAPWQVNVQIPADRLAFFAWALGLDARAVPPPGSR